MWSGVTTPNQLLARHKQQERAIEHDACVDAKAVFDGVTAECQKKPADKPLFIHALAMREHLEAGWIDRLWWLDTPAMLADGMTKGATEREALVQPCYEGILKIVGQKPVFKRLRDSLTQSRRGLVSREGLHYPSLQSSYGTVAR